MKKINNIDIITNRVDDFQWIDMKFIIGVNFYNKKDQYFDNISCVDSEFIMISKSDRKYNIKVTFIDVRSLELSFAGRFLQTSLFDIMDVSDDNWEGINYLVQDIDSDDFKLYCNEIEIVSIEEITNIQSYL